MLTLSEQAYDALAVFFAAREKMPLRVFLALGGEEGPRLGLAPGEPASGDAVFMHKDITFSIDTKLLQQAGTITIDVNRAGLCISSSVFSPSRGKGCAGSCGGCSASGSCASGCRA